jgi:hypothetical protein
MAAATTKRRTRGGLAHAEARGKTVMVSPDFVDPAMDRGAVIAQLAIHIVNIIELAPDRFRGFSLVIHKLEAMNY